jgi:hypothetical protein
VIHEEEKSPLSVEDYKRAGGLEEQDKSPSDGGLSLYSTDYFEGDIIQPLVNPPTASRFCCIPSLSLFLLFLLSHFLLTKLSPAGTP